MTADAATLHHLAVDRDHRRKGIGKPLVQACYAGSAVLTFQSTMYSYFETTRPGERSGSEMVGPRVIWMSCNVAPISREGASINHRSDGQHSCINGQERANSYPDELHNNKNLGANFAQTGLTSERAKVLRIIAPFLNACRTDACVPVKLSRRYRCLG